MFSQYAITKEDAEKLSDIIPASYLAELAMGRLMGILTVNTSDKEQPVVGAVLYRQVDGSLEIEWVGLTAAYNLPDYGISLTKSFLDTAAYTGRYETVYAAFHEEERMARYFPEENWTLTREPSHVLRFSLEDISKHNLGPGEKKLKYCIPLGTTDARIRGGLTGLAETFAEPLPLEQPVRWENYDQELSAIYCENDEVGGCILVSSDEEELVIRLVFSTNPKAVGLLLAHAARAAREKYLPGKQIVCPVLNGVSEGLVMKIVKNPVREELIRAEHRMPVWIPDSEMLSRYDEEETVVTNEE